MNRSKKHTLSFIPVLILAGWLGLTFYGCGSDSSTHPGTLDTSFNSPLGYALFSSRADIRDRGTKLVIQPDGKIVVAGYSNDGKHNDLLVLRYDATGALDNGFGAGGAFFYSGSGDNMAFGLTLQPDGKIVVVGRTQTNGNNDVLTMRLNSNGTLDTTFGQGGVVVYIGPGGATDTGRGVVVQPDGKILVSCESFNGTQKDAIILRYNSNGVPDNSFGTGGVARYSGTGRGDTYGFGITMQPDGKIIQTGNGVFAGKTKEDVILLRYLPNGTLDTSFASGGVFTYSSEGDYDDFGDLVVLQPNGRILVVGGTWNTANSDIMVLRCDATGVLDKDFGANGVVRLGATADYDYAWGLALQNDGKILVAGTSAPNNVYQAEVYRLNVDGTPDDRFGTGGVYTHSVSGGYDAVAYSVGVQTGGKIVVAGYQHTPESSDNVLVFRLMGD
ncbi:MAG: hypothetical protein HQK59_13555 [Deltaproteobacteria bacterium]|nr:hypothetical protein [Deltaproteobacteria bacterium]